MSQGFPLPSRYGPKGLSLNDITFMRGWGRVHAWFQVKVDKKQLSINVHGTGGVLKIGRLGYLIALWQMAGENHETSLKVPPLLYVRSLGPSSLNANPEAGHEGIWT